MDTRSSSASQNLFRHSFSDLRDNTNAQTMAPRLDETCAEVVCPPMDIFESNHILADFLLEMDELDRLLDTPLKHTELKRTRELETHTEQEPKRIKTTTPLSPSMPKSLPRKRRSTSWLRRKEELNSLRSETDALETHMVFLQMQRARYAAQAPLSDTLTETQEMWKSVAAIAKQECQNAQAENARLKRELDTYCRATQVLQAQLSHAKALKALHDSKFSFTNAVRVGIMMSRRLDFDDTAVFDMLESKVGARCVDVDMIISEAQRLVESGFTERVRVCRDEGKDAAAAVEFQHARLLPFAEDTTSNTIWEIMELGGLFADQQFRVAKRSNDMVVMASRFTLPSESSSKVSVDVRAVARRFDTSVGMVVLVESLSEWSIQHTTAGDWKQSTEEAGWVVVNKLPHEDTSSTCQVRTMMKLRPNAPSVGSSRSSFTGGVGDVVVPSFREILSSHHQSVENFLLDASRTQT